MERTRHGSRRRWFLLAGFGGVVLAVSGGVWLTTSLAREVPLWWRTVRSNDPKTQESAKNVEDGVWNHLYSKRAGPEDRGGVEWSVSLRASDANAWLNARFPMWIANQWDAHTWPEELREVQVNFEHDQIHVGIEVRMNDGRRILSATIHPTIGEDGSLWMPASWVHVGRLGIPARLVLGQGEGALAYLPDHLRDMPETQGMLAAFAGEIPMVGDAIVSLGDGRRVRLVSLRAHGGWLEITCRTEQVPHESDNPPTRDESESGDISAEVAQASVDDR